MINKFSSPYYPFKSHFLKTEFGNLHYVDEGDESKEVIVMLHGNPTWSFYYRNLIQTLRKDYRCVAMDHLGCGLSDRPENFSYRLEGHIKNALLLIDFLGLKKFSLVVHDWGGAIGMGVAVRRVEQIHKIIITNTAAFRSQSMPQRIALCRSQLVGEFLVRQFNLFAWPATFMATSKGLSKEIKRGYLAPYNNYANRIAIARFVQDIPLEVNHPSYKTLQEIEERLPNLKVPKLILWGGKDFCFNDTFYKRWREIYPEAQHHYFKEAGHYLFEDAFPECQARIEKFLHYE